jgi:hypothetical protein
MARTAIYLESVPKRTFACAVAWPGWSRSGKTEEAALEALLASAGRYADVAELTDQRFAAPRSVEELEIVERLTGSAGTEFGVPSHTPKLDEEPLDGPGLARLTSLLEAAWMSFDRAAAGAEGVELRKGPRGGGRELAKIRGHVLEAEEAYLRQIGRRPPKDGDAGSAERMALIRAAALETLAAIVNGGEIEDRANVKKPWLPRYHIRRSAWHALDHAWEIVDRAGPA